MLMKVNALSAFVLCCVVHHAVSQDYPPCYQEGLTWASQSIEALPATDSAFACQAACINTSNCSGFTWYDLASPLIPEVCILYENTEDVIPCSSCVSGPASCTCSSEFACVVSGTNLLDIVAQVGTEMECLIECASLPDCLFYTWYDQTSMILNHDCFLFSSCEDVDLETAGPHSGPVNCGSSTPHTTGETTTSSDLVTTTETGTTGATSCELPENPSNGVFDCLFDDSYLTCDLLCDPGYATVHRSHTQCHGGFWSHDPVNMFCETTLLLVAGGEFERIQAELYSTDGSSSCNLSDLPDYFYNHTVQYVDGDIIMMERFDGSQRYYGKTYVMESGGGWFPTSSQFPVSANFIYITKALMVVQRSKLFAAAKRRYSNGYKFDTIAFEMSPALTYDWNEKFKILNTTHDTSHDGPCSVSVSLDTYITTGVYDYNYKTYNGTALVNTANGTVTTLEPMHVSRKNHGCTHYKKDGVDYVLVAGGQDDGAEIKSSEILNLSTGIWQMAGNMSVPRSGLRIAVVEGGKVVATGLEHMKGVEEFDTEELEWKSLETDLKKARNNHAVTPVPASLISCESMM